ncbi:MAG: 4Fe-4S dicluster domain-containing protein [Pseudomonadota bacterium]
MIVLNTKTETDEKIEIALRLYVDEISLVLNKSVCIKCDVCKTVCPKEAISVIRDDKEVRIDIDEEKCVLCEVCSHFCPVSAITLTYNNVPKKILLDNQGVLPFPKRITIDTSRCPSHCSKNPEGEHRWCRRNEELIENTYEDCPKFCFSCVQNCPRELLTIEDETVEPDEARCLGCPHCQDSCEFGSITTTPLFSGEISIDSERCPEECTKCIDQCPTEAISREGKEVTVDDRYCSFCGACLNICDKEAIRLKRSEVKAEDGEFSAAWSNAVEKLTD